jgi:DNA-directed RNA polymerase specialized sigma subunit, sigma54 homolog
MSGLHQSAQMGQQQMLSPQMRQSLEILQANALELQQMVRQEIETNPVLEEEEPEEETRVEELEEDGANDESDELSRLEEDWGAFSGQGARHGDPEAEARRRHFLEGSARRKPWLITSRNSWADWPSMPCGGALPLCSWGI